MLDLFLFCLSSFELFKPEYFFQLDRHVCQSAVGWIWKSSIWCLSPSGTLNGVLAGVLAVNVPQIALSLIYVIYNGLFTCMLVSLEWLSYARRRKSLRTSVPKGAQRSTYWISLPCRYSVPLLIASGSLHWFMSQGLFLVQIDVYGFADGFDPDNPDPTSTPVPKFLTSITTIGWSSLSLLFVIILGAMMILIIFGFGLLRHYENEGMPLAGTCSRAISVGCHPLPGRCNEHLQKIKYGVIEEFGSRRGHVGFSCTKVKPLAQGGRYF